jgi:serine/threonine protein kinase
MLSPNTVLQNRYRIVRQLGKGGMGTVYLAIDERFDSTVALKETFFQEEMLRKAFEREANLLHRLRHPAVPRVTDHFTENSGQFLVMEFVSGEDLGEMIKKKGEPFPPEKVLEWADQVLDALEYIHSQNPPIVHRDIKPQNLKLTEEDRIILLDFGLAKGTFGFNTSLVTSKSVLGFTPNFAPLEQIQATGTEPRSDLYSLAATLYFLLTNTVPPDALSRASNVVGELPDPLRPADEINLHVSSDVATVLRRAMALHPNQRFASAAEMRAMLRNAIQKEVSVNNELKETILSPAAISSAPTEISQEQSSEDRLTETKKIQLEYWTAFRDYLQSHNSLLITQKPQAQTWFPIVIGRSNFRLEASTQRKGRKVCAYLILSGPDAKSHFHLLQRDKEAIEHEIGESLEWSERPTREQCYVFLCKHKTDPENRQDWETQHEWLKEKLELFHVVFAQRIKNLNASDYAPEDNVNPDSVQITPTIASPAIISNSPFLTPPVSLQSGTASTILKPHKQDGTGGKRVAFVLVGLLIVTMLSVGVFFISRYYSNSSSDGFTETTNTPQTTTNTSKRNTPQTTANTSRTNRNSGSTSSTTGSRQDFTLVNRTGVEIHNVFISPHDSDDWQEDILGPDTLPDGQSVDIQFHRNEKAAMWDLRVEDKRRNAIEWENLNLLEISKITLHYKNGRATAEVE